VWEPDPTASVPAKAREVARAYRAAAMEQQARAEAAEALLNTLMNRVRGLMQTTNPDMVRLVDKALAGGPSDQVRDLDVRFTEWGEDWHVREPVELDYDDSDWLPSKTIIKLMGISDSTLCDMRMKGLVKHRFLGERAGHVYQLGEVREVRASLPGRGRPGLPKVPDGQPRPRPAKKAAPKKAAAKKKAERGRGNRR
jgi:hypothetical protein